MTYNSTSHAKLQRTRRAAPVRRAAENNERKVKSLNEDVGASSLNASMNTMRLLPQSDGAETENEDSLTDNSAS